MPEVRQEVLDAFRMMWGLYPEPVMLIHAGREIIAMNKRAESLGISLESNVTPCTPATNHAPVAWPTRPCAGARRSAKRCTRSGKRGSWTGSGCQWTVKRTCTSTLATT